jgi:uncharacterized protein YndB with AHSA1/START domain
MNMARRRLSYDHFIVALVSLLALIMTASLGRALLGPLIETDDELLIRAPYEEVWEYITANDKRILWETGIISIVPLETGEFKPGARNLLIYALDERAFEIEETILRVKPGDLEASRIYDKFDSTWAVNLRQIDVGQVLISVKQIRRPKKFYLKWMAPWLGWRDSRRLNKALHNLSELVEQTD